MTKIYYDPETTNISYEVLGFTLYFSSEFCKNKFIRIYNERKENNNLKLEYLYKCTCDFDIMLMLYYYKLVEKRIFRVDYKGKTLEKDYVLNISLD